MTETPDREPSLRRIPVIVIERPRFDVARFVGLLLVCLLVAALAGLLLWWTAGFGAGELAPADLFVSAWTYFPAALLVAVLAGVGLGWGWKRAATARIEMVEVAPSARVRRLRRSVASTDLALRGR